MTSFGATMLDLTIALIVLASGVLSWSRGFAEEFVTILAWAAGLFVAIQFAEFGTRFVPEMFNEITLGERSYGLTEFHAPISGVILFLLTFVAVSQLHRMFTRRVKERDSNVLRRGDRVMGLLFGLFRGWVLVLALTLIVGTLPSVSEAGFWRESRLTPHFVEAAEMTIDWMPEHWRGHFHYPRAEELVEDLSETITETLPDEEMTETLMEGVSEEDLELVPEALEEFPE